MIPVTKTFFPPIEEYQKQIERIWENKWLTNRGQLTLELEKKLKKYLGVPNVILNANGTLPIQIALNALAECGEVITTPFSYVATTSAIVWEKCSPVFVDIHPEYLTIDETKIEAAITNKTTAILATHVYGNPCNIEAIEKIAHKHKLKVIYDAAHCFGVEYKGESIFNFGDVSTCSFHATKIFHTGEGGTLFCNDIELYKKMFYKHNFGHKSKTEYQGVGINAKMSELQAAMGLTVLPYMDDIITARKHSCDLYDSLLNFELIKRPKFRAKTKWNYCYYPIILNSEKQLLEAELVLAQNDIIPRRYFFPSLSKLNYVNNINDTKISDDISTRVMCLPLYYGLKDEEVIKISNLLNNIVLI